MHFLHIFLNSFFIRCLNLFLHARNLFRLLFKHFSKPFREKFVVYCLIQLYIFHIFMCKTTFSTLLSAPYEGEEIFQKQVCGYCCSAKSLQAVDLTRFWTSYILYLSLIPAHTNEKILIENRHLTRKSLVTTVLKYSKILQDRYRVFKNILKSF